MIQLEPLPNRQHELTLAWLFAFTPPTTKNPSKWVEEELRLPEEASALAGKIRLFTYQRGMLDAIAEPGVEVVAYQVSVQTGKSTVLDGAWAYKTVNDPGPALLVHVDEDSGTKYVNDRLKNLISCTPVLNARIGGGKGGANLSSAHIRYPGGNLRLASANKPSSLRSRANKLLVLDEVDAYPKSSQGKGEPTKLALDRNITYRGKGGLALIASTPTEKDGSRIESYVNRGDLRRFFVQFECCGREDYFRMDMLQYEQGRPESAVLVCPDCGSVHDEAARRRMIAKGDWRATQQGERGVISFHAPILISEVTSVTLEWIANKHMRERNTAAERMAFQNSYAAETYSPETEAQLDADKLYARTAPIEEPYPSEIDLINCGVDVQSNRVEVVWWGFAKAGITYLIDHARLMGDTSAPAGTGIWLDLDKEFARTFKLKDGTIIAPSAYAVDSGHLQEIVAAFVVGQRRKQRNAFAVKGAKAWDAPPVRLGAKIYGVTQQVQVGTVGLKKTLLARLAINERAPGYVYLPAHLSYDVIEQLTSEVIVTEYVRGNPRDRAEKVPGIRNEVLDASIYAHAMSHIPGIKRRVVGAVRAAMPQAQQQPSIADLAASLHQSVNGA